MAVHPSSAAGKFAGFALLASLALALTLPLNAANKRDFVFFFTSDPHIGSEDPKAVPPVTREVFAARAEGAWRRMLETIGQPYPASPSPRQASDVVARPRGIFLAGDLTDNLDWPRFEALFPPAGAADGAIPLFLGIGNHDGPPGGATREGVVVRNRAALAAGRLAAISENGLHTAIVWDGVHIVGVNLAPADRTDSDTPFKYGKPGDGSWNDPAGALAFLGSYLRKAVGKSGAPVIIWQHYGYCEGFNFDWHWWSARQRRQFYDLAKDYNVVALLHGHTHEPAHYRWPDPGTSPEEVERLFGSRKPKNLRSFDVFSAGALGDGNLYVFRVTTERLRAFHRGPAEWSQNPALDLDKPLTR